MEMRLIQFVFCILKLFYIEASFYTINNGGTSIKDKRIIHNTTAPSLITCSLKCRIIDKEAFPILDKEKCSCVKNGLGNDDNGKDVTLAGTFLQLKTLRTLKTNNNRCKRIVIKSGPSIIEQGHLETTIPKLTKEFILSLDIKPEGFKNGAFSVLHMTTGRPSSAHGARIPAVFQSGPDLKIYTDINGNNHHKIELEDAMQLHKWITVKMSQLHDSSGDWIYNVQVNGALKYRIINRHPFEFFDVFCYLSNPWNAAQKGSIRNVWLDVCDD